MHVVIGLWVLVELRFLSVQMIPRRTAILNAFSFYINYGAANTDRLCLHQLRVVYLLWAENCTCDESSPAVPDSSICE